jgi:hypothetical protein
MPAIGLSMVPYNYLRNFMSKVVRYFHLRTDPQFMHTGGVTVKVTGDLNFLGQVDIQYAVCSKRDAYVKKTGRSLADIAPVKVVPLRYLPRELQRLANSYKINNDNYDYAVSYFLPKE